MINKKCTFKTMIYQCESEVYLCPFQIKLLKYFKALYSDLI
jgi:hypothetical protein